MHAKPRQSPGVDGDGAAGVDRRETDVRRDTRVTIRVPLTVYRGKKAVSVETTDVSFKGLFVCTSDPPPLRSLVRLRVSLAGHEFVCHAMAVHVVAESNHDLGGRRPHEGGVGLQFWGLSGPDRKAWDDFVRSLVHARRGPAAPTATAASGVRIVVTRSTTGEPK